MTAHSFVSRFKDFHARARDATGLSDFGEDDYHEPMRLLLADLDEHCRFNELGQGMLEAEIVGRLVARLVTEDGFKRYPQFADAPLEKPVIVVGMARTGTTALLRLLTQDRANQLLELWLGCLPMPRPPRETWEAHPAYRQIAAQIDQLYALNPAIKRIHPMDAALPDECRFAIDQTFWSPSAGMTANLPNYRQWCLSCDARYAFRRYRRILGLIAGGDARRWVLKDPCHNFGFDALLEVFADACIVQTHREPAVSLASVCSLTYELRRLREPDITPLDNGRYQMEGWLAGLEKAETWRARSDPGRFFDVMAEDLQSDPVATVEALYRHFDLPLDETTRGAWRQLAAADPRAGHGRHEYDAAAYGFTTESVRARVPDYSARLTRLRADRAA